MRNVTLKHSIGWRFVEERCLSWLMPPQLPTCTVACDVEVTQLVDGNVGVHVRIPKSIFTRARPGRAAP